MNSAISIIYDLFAGQSKDRKLASLNSVLAEVKRYQCHSDAQHVDIQTATEHQQHVLLRPLCLNPSLSHYVNRAKVEQTIMPHGNFSPIQSDGRSKVSLFPLQPSTQPLRPVFDEDSDLESPTRYCFSYSVSNCSAS